MNIVKSQIKEHEKRGLVRFSKNIDAVMRLRHGFGMASLLQNVDLKNDKGVKRNHVSVSKLKTKLASVSKVIFTRMVVFHLWCAFISNFMQLVRSDAFCHVLKV